MKIGFSEKAISDLESISSYIGNSLYNQKAANGIAAGLLTEIKKLGESPFIGSPVVFKNSNVNSIRVIRYGNYGAFYRVVGDMVQVDRILYLKSDFQRVLEDV